MSCAAALLPLLCQILSSRAARTLHFAQCVNRLKRLLDGVVMAEIVAFPTESATLSDKDTVDRAADLLDEGLELLADYRAIEDQQVRASLRALVKSLGRRSGRAAG